MDTLYLMDLKIMKKKYIFKKSKQFQVGMEVNLKYLMDITETMVKFVVAMVWMKSMVHHLPQEM